MKHRTGTLLAASSSITAVQRPSQSLAAPSAAGQGVGIKAGDTVLSGGVELKVRSIYRNVAEVVSFSGAFIGYRAVSNLQQVR